MNAYASIYISNNRNASPFRLWAHHQQLNIRDWRPNNDKEHINIYNVLLQHKEQSVFDPEGSLELDVLDKSSMQESYSNDDGGCFLVAIAVDYGDHSEDILGTLGMISGTKVMYKSSGSSLSNSEVTAALRRVCALGSSEMVGNMSEKNIFQELICEGEKRALQSGATNIIGLAYPKAMVTNNNKIIIKPSVELFESLGYQASNEQIPGVDTIQYEKKLSQNQLVPQEANWIVPTTIITLLSIAYLLFNLYTNVFGIEQFWGSSDNAGLGTSLSTQNLEELIRDEQLRRSDLDDGFGSRQWGDLSPEELREEQALMKIIQGQSIRSK